MRAALLLTLTLAACDRGAPAADARAAARAAAPVEAKAAAPVVADTPTIRLLELAGDMRLDPAERGQLAALQARERAGNAADDAKDDREIEGILSRYAGAGAVERAKMRHQLRVELHYGRAKMSDPLPARLLDRHDPVLVEDKARRELVTLADMRALDASNRFIARIAGTAVPDMTERPGERAELQRRYAADASLRTALIHAGPRHAMMVAAIEGLPTPKRVEIERVIREQVHTPEDAANAARGAENAVILAGQRKAQRASDAAALADFKRWIYQRNQVTLGMARLDGVRRVLDTENRYYPR